jgi:polyisoprenoid-binding protein YceI
VLQLKAHRCELDVPFSLRRENGKAFVSGTLTVNRLDYGIGTGEWADTRWLAGEVKVDFRAALSGR